jgi:hypothetical protein
LLDVDCGDFEEAFVFVVAVLVRGCDALCGATVTLETGVDIGIVVLIHVVRVWT